MVKFLMVITIGYNLYDLENFSFYKLYIIYVKVIK